MKPYDLIRHELRFWEVLGVHHGGMGQESVIALRSVDRSPAWDERPIMTMHVPEQLLRAAIQAGVIKHYEASP